MTEEEAKKKLCPNAWGTVSEISETAKRSLLRQGGTCTGERCMAWRWRLPHLSDGFCGLAGMP